MILLGDVNLQLQLKDEMDLYYALLSKSYTYTRDDNLGRCPTTVYDGIFLFSSFDFDFHVPVSNYLRAKMFHNVVSIDFS